MSRPNSPEDICNLSLDMLKQNPLASITTPVTNSEFIFARWYDMERQSALRAHPWKFATKRATLTPNLSTPPPFGYTNAYDLPNDYLRMVSLGDDYLGDLRMKHVIENGQILTPSGSTNTFNTTTLYIRYVYDIVTVAQFDPLFVKYFATGMAMDLSNKFAISAALGKDLRESWMDIKTEAKAVNGQDSPIIRIQQSRLLTKRRGLPGGIYASKYTIFDS